MHYSYISLTSQIPIGALGTSELIDTRVCNNSTPGARLMHPGQDQIIGLHIVLLNIQIFHLFK